MHVLSTPPAFVLSQDQTLQTKPQTAMKENHHPAHPPHPPPHTRNTRTHNSRHSRQTKTKQTRHNQTHKQTQPQRIHGIKNMTHYRDLKQHTHTATRPQTQPPQGNRGNLTRTDSSQSSHELEARTRCEHLDHAAESTSAVLDTGYLRGVTITHSKVRSATRSTLTKRPKTSQRHI